MEDSIIIKNFLFFEYPNSHPIVFLYIHSKLKNNNYHIEKMIKLCNKVFNPSINEDVIRKSIFEYLDSKLKH